MTSDPVHVVPSVLTVAAAMTKKRKANSPLLASSSPAAASTAQQIDQSEVIKGLREEICGLRQRMDRLELDNDALQQRGRGYLVVADPQTASSVPVSVAAEEVELPSRSLHTIRESVREKISKFSSRQDS